MVSLEQWPGTLSSLQAPLAVRFVLALCILFAQDNALGKHELTGNACHL